VRGAAERLVRRGTRVSALSASQALALPVPGKTGGEAGGSGW
jgi:hypothetical protein